MTSHRRSKADPKPPRADDQPQGPKLPRTPKPLGEKVLVAFLLVPGFLIFGLSETLLEHSAWFTVVILAAMGLVFLGIRKYWSD